MDEPLCHKGPEVGQLREDDENVAGFVGTSRRGNFESSDKTKEKERKFNAFIIKAYPELLSFALKLTRNPYDAEDLLHSTCLNFIEYIDKHYIGLGSDFYTVLCQRMKRIFNSERRDKEGLSSAICDMSHIIDASVTSEVYEPISDRVLAVLADVEGPKSKTRKRTETLALRINGFEYSEIASKLSIPEGTVMSGLQKARINVRERLQELDPSYAEWFEVAFKHNLRVDLPC